MPMPVSTAPPPLLPKTERTGAPDVLLAWWSWRGCPTRSHSELGRETPQRPWYCASRHGRVGRRQANQTPGAHHHPTDSAPRNQILPELRSSTRVLFRAVLSVPVFSVATLTAIGVLHKDVRDSASGEGVNRLVQQVDRLLIHGPGPWRGADARGVLQRLIVEQPKIQKDEGPDRAANPPFGHQR